MLRTRLRRDIFHKLILTVFGKEVRNWVNNWAKQNVGRGGYFFVNLCDQHQKVVLWAKVVLKPVKKQILNREELLQSK